MSTDDGALTDEERGDLAGAIHEGTSDGECSLGCSRVYEAVERIIAARAAQREPQPSETAEHRHALLRAVVAYDDANQSDLPLTLLDAIRAEVGGPR